MATAKRPNILVRDARDGPPQRPQMVSQRTNSARPPITVDSLLMYSSEIPSGQKRGPPRQSMHSRTPSGRRPLDPKLAGRLIPQYMPTRTSKVSEKLVLLPETDNLEEKGEFEDEEDSGPPRDSNRRPKPHVLRGKSYAEKLDKASRADKVSRVTAYCIAQGFKMHSTAEFVRKRHGAKTKLYDDCLYTVYHLPLLPGHDGGRIRSSPVLKSPGGKAVLDEEIERNERHEYQGGYFGEEQYEVRHQANPSTTGDEEENAVLDTELPTGFEDGVLQPSILRRSSSPGSAAHLASSINNFAEMFVFSYGVAVFWNFSERQEKDILADLSFSSTASGAALAIPLTIRPLDEADFETEAFHFEYNPEIPRPRVYNDMITLRSADHMIKLSMSHAIAQSTKLSFFEERMSETMEEAQHVPKRLALQGELGMKREEVVRMVGRLFKSRVDVNLSSNMLDVPNFFWDSEPTLHPLYSAVREYLEIKTRVQVMNERCNVFLDLASILTESINDRKMSRLTWIIIILIVLSICVTLCEVFLRFALLSTEKGKRELVHAAYLELYQAYVDAGLSVGALNATVTPLLLDSGRVMTEL